MSLKLDPFLHIKRLRMRRDFGPSALIPPNTYVVGRVILFSERRSVWE